ncbi:hypothetical protein YC2023_043108 [Brassica napus]
MGLCCSLLPYFIGHLFRHKTQVRINPIEAVSLLPGNLVKTLLAEASSADEHGLSVTQIVLSILGAF